MHTLDEIDYTFDVTNSGSLPLSDITVTDPLVTVSCPLVDTVGNNDDLLDPGETIQCTATYTLLQADIEAGSRDNEATAQGTAPLGTVVEDKDQNTETIDRAPALSVVKSSATLLIDPDGSTDITLGDTLEFTITATNTGNVTLDNVVVTDAQLTPTGGNTDCLTVTPGDTCTLIGTYVVTVADANAGMFDNTGCANSDDTSEVCDDERTPIEQDPAIEILKTGSITTGDGSDVDDIITYTFTIKNIGNVTLTGVDISDALLGLSGATCDATTTLAPTESTVCTDTYDIDQDDLDAGKVDNSATATGTPPEGEDVSDDDPESVNLTPEVDINIDKGPDNQAVQVFDDVTWTITVTNTGDVTLTDVVVTDALAPDCDRDSNDIPALASMAPGDEVEYQCTLQNVLNFLNNIADVDALDPNEQPVEDSDTSLIIFTSAIAAIGDTVWADEDGDGIEDAGEIGVPNVDVILYECNTPACDDILTEIDTETTDGDGHYQFINLPVANYLVEIDLSTVVDGALTTPGTFVVPLADEAATDFQDADFGIEEVLPVTGIDADRLGWFGVMLLAFGGMAILGSGYRRREE